MRETSELDTGDASLTVGQLAATVRWLCVGLTGSIVVDGKPVDSAYFKHPVPEVAVSPAGLPGDEHAYAKHRGPDRVLLSYPLSSYEYWRTEHGLDLPEYSAFGENLTTDGLTEAEAHIGDVFEVGAALIQVTQPRSPCFKIAARYGVPRLAVTVAKTGRTGILYRCLRPGVVRPGDSMRLVSREGHGVSVADVNAVMHDRPLRDEASTIVELESLADATKSSLRARLNRRKPR